MIISSLILLQTSDENNRESSTISDPFSLFSTVFISKIFSFLSTDRAIKIVAKDDASKFDADNVVVINPEENSEEEQLMKDKMEAR